MKSNRLQSVSLSLCLLGIACGGPKSSSESPANPPPSPDTLATASDLPAKVATVKEPQEETVQVMPEGLAHKETQCRGVGAQYTFTKMLYKGTTCDIRLSATSPEVDLNDWDSAGLTITEGKPNEGFFSQYYRSANLLVDLDQRSLVIHMSLFGAQSDASTIELVLRKKSTGETYFLTLNPAQKEDLYESFDVVQSAEMVLNSTSEDGKKMRSKALVRRDNAGIPVLRANEMLAFDYKVKGLPGILISGVPTGGSVRLAAPYEGLGSFFNKLEESINAFRFHTVQGPSDDLNNQVTWQLYAGDWTGPQLSQYRVKSAGHEPVTYRGLVEGVYTSRDGDGLELASAPFKFRLVDESLAKDLDIQVKSNADGSFDSVRVKNLADYDLRPLAMEYEITCVGNNISLGGALYMDQASAMRGEQTTRMLPGAVWEVSSQDIVTALKLKASDSNDPNVYDMSSCRDAKIKLQVWEANYLTGLKLGDVVDLVDGDAMPIHASPAK